MSWKTFLVFIVLILLGVFLYFKVQVMGSPDSRFNQTTRFTLGKHPVMRTILGLHQPGDARAEYLGSGGPIYLVWFKPEIEIVDPPVLSQFSDMVAKYTGRPVNLLYDGSLGEATVPLDNLNSVHLASNAQVPSGATRLLLYFALDYSPRQGQELSTTYLESGLAVSLTAERNFSNAYLQDQDPYLLLAMLREFGLQIGLPETSGNSDCVMNTPVGVNSQPFEAANLSVPQDFCPSEQQAIAELRAKY